MCLQWCHVRDVLIDNDIPCQALCPDAIRLAQAGQSCQTCRHHRGGLCMLTQERLPLVRSCCHWNAEPRRFDLTVLHLGVNVPTELTDAHQAATLRDIFDLVDSAPELPPDAPEDGILLRAADLTLPLVYGVCAACWEQALSGQPDPWCSLCQEKGEGV